jgi:hypothetical protein
VKLNQRNAGDLIVLGDDAKKGQRPSVAGVLRSIREDTPATRADSSTP